MSGETQSALLAAVKNYLDITWTDPASDEKLAGIIARGMVYVDKQAAATCDYTIEGAPRALLFDYCRYARSNALEEFATNFLHELTALRMEAMSVEPENDNTNV